MEPAPLPPHERTWRHPSEVGPNRFEIAADGHRRPVLLAAGALAALMVVVMIVAMTPRPAAGPEAISATTRPASAPPANGEQQGVTASRTARLASFAPIPNAIAAAPVARQNTIVIARALPLGDEAVLVKTEHVTYRLGWSDVEFLGLEDRAVVLNDRGELIARIVDGDIVVLVD